jgi:3,4-dihydroxyphenylacetate 2,3-dioxygenase
MPETINQLLETGPATVPFDILRAAYAELRVADLAASRHFYVDLLGLVVTAENDDAIYLRGWEERQHHSIVLRRAESPAAARLGFRVRRDEDLGLLADELERLGSVVEWVDGEVLGMGRALRAQDPFGFPLEFFHTIEQLSSQLQRFDIHRGAPILRLDHFNLHTPVPEETFAFWQALGFRCTEYISTEGPDERLAGAWLARKPAVHDVALTLGRGPRLHHLGMWVAESIGVLRACDQLAAAGYSAAIERGPGRHGVSNAFFVYLRDPDGHRIELYASDYYTGDPDHRPLRWSVADPRCRSFWGAVAPDSWYQESTLLVDADGALVATSEADLDERRARTQVMS